MLLRFAGALQSDDLPAATPVEITVRGRHSEIDFGNAKAGGKTAIKVSSDLTYYKLVMDGVTVIEIDLVIYIHQHARA